MVEVLLGFNYSIASPSTGVAARPIIGQLKGLVYPSSPRALPFTLLCCLRSFGRPPVCLRRSRPTTSMICSISATAPPKSRCPG